MSSPRLEQLLEAELAAGSLVIGEVAIARRDDDGFELAHRSDEVPSPSASGRTQRDGPAVTFSSEEALEMARFDDTGNYRPLRTAPNLRHGWKIVVANLPELIEVIDTIYPARLAAWRAWKSGQLTTTPLRETLNRQSGMYRAAAKISDEQIDELVGDFCRSNGGCLRTILWRRNQRGEIASAKLPPEKFDPAVDQFATGKELWSASAAPACLPLLCQEGCNLLVAACREAVKRETASRVSP